MEIDESNMEIEAQPCMNSHSQSDYITSQPVLIPCRGYADSKIYHHLRCPREKTACRRKDTERLQAGADFEVHDELLVKQGGELLADSRDWGRSTAVCRLRHVFEEGGDTPLGFRLDQA